MSAHSAYSITTSERSALQQFYMYIYRHRTGLVRRWLVLWLWLMRLHVYKT